MLKKILVLGMLTIASVSHAVTLDFWKLTFLENVKVVSLKVNKAGSHVSVTDGDIWVKSPNGVMKELHFGGEWCAKQKNVKQPVNSRDIQNFMNLMVNSNNLKMNVYYMMGSGIIGAGDKLVGDHYCIASYTILAK